MTTTTKNKQKKKRSKNKRRHSDIPDTVSHPSRGPSVTHRPSIHVFRDVHHHHHHHTPPHPSLSLFRFVYTMLIVCVDRYKSPAFHCHFETGHPILPPVPPRNYNFKFCVDSCPVSLNKKPWEFMSPVSMEMQERRVRLLTAKYHWRLIKRTHSDRVLRNNRRSVGRSFQSYSDSVEITNYMVKPHSYLRSFARRLATKNNAANDADVARM